MGEWGWLIYGLLSGACFGVHAILVELTLSQRFTPMVVNTYFFSIGTLMLWLYSWMTRDVALPDVGTIGKLVAIAAVAVIGFWSIFKAYQLAPNPGYVRAAFSVNIIVAVALSALLLDVRLTRAGGLGIALIIAGTVLMAVAG